MFKVFGCCYSSASVYSVLEYGIDGFGYKSTNDLLQNSIAILHIRKFAISIGCTQLLDLRDRILVENSQIPIGKHIHLERFEFHAKFLGPISDHNRPEIRQPCFGTNRRVFGNGNCNVVGRILVGPAFD